MSLFGLNGLDILFLGLIAAFGVRGLLRGMIVEITGILGLVLGFVAANHWYPQIAQYLDFVESGEWRVIGAYLGAFFVTLLGVSLVGRLLRKIVQFGMVSWLDHLAGAVIGMVTGLLMCALILAILQVALPNAGFLRDSTLAPYITSLTEKGRAALPNITRQGFSLKKFLNI